MAGAATTGRRTRNTKRPAHPAIHSLQGGQTSWRRLSEPPERCWTCAAVGCKGRLRPHGERARRAEAGGACAARLLPMIVQHAARRASLMQTSRPSCLGCCCTRPAPPRCCTTGGGSRACLAAWPSCCPPPTRCAALGASPCLQGSSCGMPAPLSVPVPACAKARCPPLHGRRLATSPPMPGRWLPSRCTTTLCRFSLTALQGGELVVTATGPVLRSEERDTSSKSKSCFWAAFYTGKSAASLLRLQFQARRVCCGPAAAAPPGDNSAALHRSDEALRRLPVTLVPGRLPWAPPPRWQSTQPTHPPTHPSPPTACPHRLLPCFSLQTASTSCAPPPAPASPWSTTCGPLTSRCLACRQVRAWAAALVPAGWET